MARAERLDPKYINKGVQLPFGFRVNEVEKAIQETYRLLHGINDFLTGADFRRLEELLLGNSLSGIISEFLVKNIARSSKTLEANIRIGGYPDLLPVGHYDSNSILKGDAGIEVKASIQGGGWQGHNPEDGWVIVFRYKVGQEANDEFVPITFVEILCAKLMRSDWSFSGRRGASRRTPTASIARSGVEKLRENFLYRIPGVGVGKHRNILADIPKLL